MDSPEWLINHIRIGDSTLTVGESSRITSLIWKKEDVCEEGKIYEFDRFCSHLLKTNSSCLLNLGFNVECLVMQHKPIQTPDLCENGCRMKAQIETFVDCTRLV
jgi:hypothetical protein